MNMKVNFVAFSLSACIWSITGEAFAADSSQYDLEGTVSFVPSTAPTQTVDPLNPDPDNPIIPITPDESNPDIGKAGSLSLDFASSLDFGIQQITSSTVSYNASAQKYTDRYGNNEDNGPDFVQLTDNRGSFFGWTLSIKQTGQFTTANGDELKGASVTFSSVQHAAANGLSNGISLTSNFTLVPNDVAIPVLSGSAANGNTNGTYGTHVLRFGDKTSLSNADVNGDGSSRGITDTAIKLIVPGKTLKLADKYTTVFNWILGDTPSSVAVVK